MALQSGLARQRALPRPHQAGRRLRRLPRPVVRQRALGGAERLLPSTIAAEIAGLVAAGRIADRNGDDASARVYRASADHFQRSIKGWTVTTTGPYAAALLHPAVQDRRPGRGDHLQPRQRQHRRRPARVVDQGFLELTRLGALPADDPDVAARWPSWTTSSGARRRPAPASTATGPTHRHRGRLRRLPGPRPDRLLADRQAVADRQPGLRAPVAGARRRARRAAAAARRPPGAAALLAAMRVRLGRRPGARAGWEDPAVAAPPFGTDPTDRLDRLQAGRGGRLGLTADLGPGPAVRLISRSAPAARSSSPRIRASRYASPLAQAPLTVTAPADGPVDGDRHERHRHDRAGRAGRVAATT